MPATSVFSESEQAKIIRLANEGKKPYQIAKAIGRDREQIASFVTFKRSCGVIKPLGKRGGNQNKPPSVDFRPDWLKAKVGPKPNIKAGEKPWDECPWAHFLEGRRKGFAG